MTPRPALWLAVLLALAGPVRAADTAEDPSELCERAIINGARRGGVPVEVLHAVALNETGRKEEGRLRAWPWAINREGQGYWFKTYEEALAFARRASPRAGRASTSAASRSTTAGMAMPFRRSRPCSTPNGRRPMPPSSCARSTRSAATGRRRPAPTTR